MQDLTQISKIALALAKAQAEFPLIARTKTARIQTKNGSSYSYDYADLAVLIGSVRPALAKNELAFTQFVEYEDVWLKVTTLLMHSSGEYLTTTFKIKVMGDDLKAIGTAITYIRRYSLSAILGIASDEDKDDPSGQEQSKAKAKPRQLESASRSSDPDFTNEGHPDGKGGEPPKAEAKPKHTVETVRAFLLDVDLKKTVLKVDGWRKINRTVTRLALELGLEDAINSHSMIEGVEVSETEARDNTLRLLEACEAEKTARTLEGQKS